MSTWTNEKHEAAQEVVRVVREAPVVTSSLRAAVGTLGDALDEIERLRAESARRMVWLEREQKAHEQTRAALIDMTERAAHPVITDDMVTAARKTMDDHWAIPLPYSWACECGMTVEGTDGHAQAVILSHIARTGLEAALTPKENQS